MAKFIKEEFNFYGMYLTYGQDRKFVARFKYAKDGKGSFVTFLIKNFTVEEYFDRHAAGEAPLSILESKGYVSPHIKKILKAQGYEPTIAGKDRYILDQMAKVR